MKFKNDLLFYLKKEINRIEGSQKDRKDEMEITWKTTAPETVQRVHPSTFIGLAILVVLCAIGRRFVTDSDK